MRLGICTTSANADIVKEVGYDFIELGVAELVPEQPDGEFAPVRERILASGLKAEALNKFIPKGIMLVGPDPDTARARRYVEVAVARAAEIGTEVIVWGSPHARQVPEGFSKERALDQLAEIGAFMGQQAEKYGQVIVIEPLDAATTNTIWTVKDGYELALRVNHKCVKTMADIYQMRMNDEPLEGMMVAGNYLAHVHVSDPDRQSPGNPEYLGFYREAFEILKKMNYQGKVSIEARFKDFPTDAKRGLAILKENVA
ncbi:MAG: sugar phosphate isomerase/epimerase [Bacteroidetes bacterium]|nr:sugar phosphate isomerase/epimerase [Bacteroidota bacterium]